MSSIKFISNHQISQHLRYVDLIPVIKNALKDYSSGKVIQPLRTVITMTKECGTKYIMPTYSASSNVLLTKILTVYPKNGDHNSPTRQGYLMLFNPDNGQLSCMMDVEGITHMRTAAATVVATQALFTGQPRVLAILGTGGQARSHLQAFCETFKFEKVKIWSRNHSKVRRFCSEIKLGNLIPCLSAEEAVHDADIIITLTPGTEPVLQGKWLKRGCHVNCVGAVKPSLRELDDECLKRAVIYADCREAAEKESGDIIASKCGIYAEIGEILLNRKPLKKGDITLFKSQGIAVEDAVTAKLVLEKIEMRS